MKLIELSQYLLRYDEICIKWRENKKVSYYGDVKNIPLYLYDGYIYLIYAVMSDIVVILN